MSKEIIVDTKKDVQIAIEKNPEMRWFIVQTAAKSEEAAKRNILEQAKVRHLNDKFGMILVPEKKVIEVKNGAKKISKKRSYPGYIFILANMDEDVMMAVRESSKVSRFVEGKPESLPKPMSSKDINQVIVRLDEDAEAMPEQKLKFEEQEKVKIVSGPLADTEGFIKKVNYERAVLTVGVMLFGRQTEVEINFNDVIKETA
jgi:transcriptional antiterminator NusG